MVPRRRSSRIMKPFLRFRPRDKRIGSEARQDFTRAANGEPISRCVQQGLDSYLDHVEQQMLNCGTASEDTLRTFFGGVGGNGTAEDGAEPELIQRLEFRVTQLLQLTIRVVKLLKDPDLDAQAILDDLARKLLDQYPVADPVPDLDARLGVAHRIIFTCIGWLTLLYAPSPELAGADFLMIESAATLSPHNSYVPVRSSPDAVHRPVGAMLRGLGVVPISCTPTQNLSHIDPQTNLPTGHPLNIAHLCFFTLRRIGQISINWVDTITEHCILDETRKELKLFRFPAFVVQAYGGEASLDVLVKILRAHNCQNGCQNTTVPLQTYLLEVILSYRLLFGLDKRSRRLFRSKEVLRAKSFESLDDSTLHILCGRKNASEITDLIGSFREREVFIAHVDFPHLGDRLLRLQEYSVNQKPTSWAAIWNDHRDPYQSVTFWAVIIVGGVSILLSLLQTVFTIGQFVVAIRPPR